MNRPTIQDYNSPSMDVVETMYEGTLCASSTSIEDIPFEYDENAKE